MPKSKAKEFVLSLRPRDIGIKLLTENFGMTANRENKSINPPKFRTNEKVHLEAKEYINREAVDTNIGIILANKILIEGKVEAVIPNGFYNEVLTKKKIEELLTLVAGGVMEDTIPVKPNLLEFLSAYEFFGLKSSVIFCPSFTMNIIKPNDKVMEAKAKMLAEAKDLSDLKTMVDIEDELVKIARKELGDDPAMGLFDSGARGSFDDAYKNMSIMIGPTKNLTNGNFELTESNYVDGIDKGDVRAMGDGVITASYPKAVGTADSGYITKQFYSVFQSIRIDEEGTDCGTKEGLEVLLTNDNVDMYLYQNIMVNGKLVNLTMENKDKFVGKKVKLRSPMFCLTPKICRACAGERYAKLGIDNIGLTAGKIPNAMLNAGMKSFHTTKVKLNDVDPEKLLI